MDEALESWIYFDGPEPEAVSEMLDLLRELPPATDADIAAMERAFFEELDAKYFDTPEARPAHEDAPAPPPRVHALRLAQPDPEDAEPRHVAEPSPPQPASPAGARPAAGVPAALAATSPNVNLKSLIERI